MVKSKSKYAVRNLTGNSAEILLYGPIGDEWGDGVSARQFARDVASLGHVSEIHLRINSPGGSVWDGMDIYNTLMRCNAKIIVDVTGIAASIATLIAMSGDEIRIASNATWMVHGVQGGCWGTIADMEDYLKLLRDGDESIKRIYAARTGLSRDRLDELMSRDNYLTADEAKELGFVDVVDNADPQAAAPANHASPTPKLQTLDEAYLSRARRTIDTLAALVADINPEGEPPMVAPAPAVIVPVPPVVPVVTVTPPAVPPVVTPIDVTPATPATAPPPAMPVRQVPASEAAEICAACNLAGVPASAATYLLAGTPIADVRTALLAHVCAARPLPPSAIGGSPEPKPAPAAKTPIDQFGEEFDANAKTLTNLGLTREQYVRSRCQDEGIDAPPVATKK